MTDSVVWRQDAGAEIAAEAVRRLARGEVVQLPTECGPVAACIGSLPEALARLLTLKSPDEPLAAALSQPNHIFDWVPWLRGVGRRVIEKFWPGPLQLVFEGPVRGGIAESLAPDLLLRLFPSGLSLRLPDHAWVELLVKHLPGPLMLASVDSSQGIDWIVTDEPGPFVKPPTVVALDGSRKAKVLREGAILRESIEEACRVRILFVCTGNTCRSPMAEALCRTLLADHLGCEAKDLAEHGFLVQSGGLAAMMGMEASAEAVAVARDMGADLSQHRSQPLTRELVNRADRIYAMTAAHWHGLVSVLPDLPVETLAGEENISDPIGADAEVYRACAAQILSCLQHRLPQFLEI